MYYIIQNNTFNEKGHDRLIETLNRFQLPYKIVKVRPFIDTIEFKTDRKDVFCFGALKLARIAKAYEWDPGCIMTKNHDFLVYRNHYGTELLNFDSKVFQFGVANWSGGPAFIRPTKDTKVFAGGVFDIAQWGAFKTMALESGYSDNLTEETLVQVCPAKKIMKEYRFFAVKGKVVTGSIYKLGRQPYFSDQIEDSALQYAQEMVDIYQLADAFVIDVCMTDRGYKIVECGCINCAGFYEADMQKLIMALEDAF